MKNNLLTLATILTIGFFTNNVSAQGATVTGANNASAKIIQVLTINEDTKMNFGTIMSSAGTVILDTNDGRTVGGGAILSALATAATSAAYTVNGATDATYSITLPSNADGITVKESGTNTTMNVTDFTYSSASVTAGESSPKLLLGEDTFKVGATLTVNAGQVSGDYLGSFNVSVDYN